jgi:Ca2+-binding RTX toxin-like protein
MDSSYCQASPAYLSISASVDTLCRSITSNDTTTHRNINLEMTAKPKGEVNMPKYNPTFRLPIFSQTDNNPFTIPGNVAVNSIGYGVLGNDLNNTINGSVGHDTIDGGLGADYMAGGLGNDVYVVDSEDDVVVENFNGGADLIRSYLTTFDLKNLTNVENLMLMDNGVTGIGNELHNNICGNNLANILEGNPGHDVLAGGGGNDNLSGGVGNDVLDGGLGNDVLEGGMGNDFFIFSTKLGNNNVDTISDFING